MHPRISLALREEKLFTELGIDSLQFMSLVMAIEERLGRRFEEEDIFDLITVGDLVERVQLVAGR